MKKISCLLMLLIIFICSGCQIIANNKTEKIDDPLTEEETNNEPLEPSVGNPEVEPTPDTKTEETTSEVVYDEAFDSLEGVDANDLSGLKYAFDTIGFNYMSHTYVYFNDLALSQVKDIFGMTFVSEQKAYFTENYVYRFTDSFSINTAYINRNNNVYSVSLSGDNLKDKLTSSVKESDLKLELENDNVYNTYFSLNSLNSEYVDNYGPLTVKYSDTYSIDYLGWTRVSENKYKCDRMEVIEDFISICAPSYPKEDGTYMTYKYVTVEIAPDKDTYLRIRLYANDTQTGKLDSSRLDKEGKPNWYLLFAEAYISKQP